MLKRPSPRRLLAVGACLAAFGGLTVNASAASAALAVSTPYINTSVTDASASAVVAVVHGQVVAVHQARAVKNQSVSASSNCTVPSPYGNGLTPCGDIYSWVTYSNGNQEWFAIGTDYHIYHIWAGSGGWHSLGGTAADYSGNGVWSHYVSDSNVWIDTVGTNNAYYCDHRGIPNWSGWSIC